MRPFSIQSNPSIPPILGLAKKGGIPKTAVLRVIYNLQSPYLGLENGRRYWEGGGLGRGGIALRGTTVAYFEFIFCIRLLIFSAKSAKQRSCQYKYIYILISEM